MSKELAFNVELPLSFEAAVIPELTSVACDARERMVRVAEWLAKR